MAKREGAFTVEVVIKDELDTEIVSDTITVESGSSFGYTSEFDFDKAFELMKKILDKEWTV